MRQSDTFQIKVGRCSFGSYPNWSVLSHTMLRNIEPKGRLGIGETASDMVL